MKKLIPYVIVFVLGFAACAWSIYHFYGPPTGFAAVESVNAPRGGIKIASGASNQVRRAAILVNEYVVNIDTVGRPIRESPEGFPFPNIFGPMLGEPQPVIPRGQASGVIFTPNGYILTNNHVVQGAAKLTVTLHSGKTYQAKLIGRDPKSDVAVIKIDATGLPHAAFGNSDTLEVGDWVIAVGNALGLGPTVTVGVVSATARAVNIDGRVLEDAIQTDAAINRGNSGGALADINGSLIGINTAIASEGFGGGNIGIGFAIPSNTAKKIAEQLVKTGKVVRPYLGIKYTGYNEDIRKELEQRGVRDLPRDEGALIIEVYPQSPAAEVGLQGQDIILKVNGKPVSANPKGERGKATIADEVGKAKIGERILMEVWHASNGHIGTVGVRVGEMPADFGE